MKQFIILLFSLPLSALASFPIEINLPKDTTIEVKKETMEEYKLRINKQLYSSSADDSSVLIQKEVSPTLLIFSIMVKLIIQSFYFIQEKKIYKKKYYNPKWKDI